MIPQYKTILCATAMSPRTKQTFCHALTVAAPSTPESLFSMSLSAWNPHR